jgi:hypothetical protein
MSEALFSVYLLGWPLPGEWSMSLITGNTVFWVAAGATLTVHSAINGNATDGGDDVGPLVAVAVPSHLAPELAITPPSVRFLSASDDGITSQAIYVYTVKNHNPFPVSFRLDKFFND